MRILHFGPFGEEATMLPLLVGFMNLGHKVKTCDIINEKRIEKKVEKYINDFRPDMVITMGGFFQNFDSETLWKILKKHSIPHVYFAIEDPTFFDWTSTVHLNAYDFVFTVSESCVPKYTALGMPSSYLSYCCNPAFHRRVEEDKGFTNDIIVLSNKYTEVNNEHERYAFRDKCYKDLIEPVLNGGYDIKIYGFGWGDGTYNIPKKNIGGYVQRSLVPTIYSSAKIVLTIQWDLTGHICYKTYEAFGCRCLQIAPYTPLQEKYFKHKEHLIYTHSSEETIKYVDYYLSNQDERENIAAKGQEEVYKNHSCNIRAKEALQVLKVNGFNIDFIEK